MLLLIDEKLKGHIDESMLNGMKFLLISQDIDAVRTIIDTDYPRFHDMEKLELKLTIRFGMMVTAGVGILATLIKLL